jgi:hypothetical protein
LNQRVDILAARFRDLLGVDARQLELLEHLRQVAKGIGHVHCGLKLCCHGLSPVGSG